MRFFQVLLWQRQSFFSPTTAFIIAGLGRTPPLSVRRAIVYRQELLTGLLPHLPEWHSGAINQKSRKLPAKLYPYCGYQSINPLLDLVYGTTSNIPPVLVLSAPSEHGDAPSNLVQRRPFNEISIVIAS